MIQIRITIDQNVDGSVYIIEAQASPPYRSYEFRTLYPHHAELLVESLSAGARLAGLESKDIAVFYPEGWNELVGADDE